MSLGVKEEIEENETYFWIKLLNFIHQFETRVPTDRKKIQKVWLREISIFNMEVQRSCCSQLDNELRIQL